MKKVFSSAIALSLLFSFVPARAMENRGALKTALVIVAGGLVSGTINYCIMHTMKGEIAERVQELEEILNDVTGLKNHVETLNEEIIDLNREVSRLRGRVETIDMTRALEGTFLSAKFLELDTKVGLLGQAQVGLATILQGQYFSLEGCKRDISGLQNRLDFWGEEEQEIPVYVVTGNSVGLVEGNEEGDQDFGSVSSGIIDSD